MKHLKLFENDNTNIKVGDYLIGTLSDVEDDFMEDFADFLETNIGKVVDIKLYNNDKNFMYIVEYDGMSEDFEEIFNNPTSVTDYDVLFSSSNKDDLQVYIESGKYNL